MIFGKDKAEFDFDSFKSDVSSAAEPLVEAVTKYDPNKKKRKYKSPTADLHESAGLFFQAAADTLDKQSSASSPDNGLNFSDKVNELKLDKKARQAGQKTQDTLREAGKRGSQLWGAAGEAAGNAAGDVQNRFMEAKLDKKLGKLTDEAGKRVKRLKLDKKTGKVVDATTGQLKDMKLDKKLGQLADNAGKQVKDLKLDKKFGKLADNASSQFNDLKLDKKAGEAAATVGGTILAAAANVGSAVKDAQLDKRLGDFADSVSSSVKDARLDKKFGDFADTVGGAVKDAQLDKRLADVGDTVGPLAAAVAGSAGAIAGNVADSVGNFIKDNKLDKRAATVAGNTNALLSLAGDKVSSAGDKASQTLKDAKLDKRLAEAQLPEKLFSAANVLPGVTVSNPKKAAKQFRKRRAQVLKAASQQQKELAKVLANRQKEAGKFVKARRKDIESGKISVPFYTPNKKSFNWGRTGLIVGGAGAAIGGVAANNARIWSAVPPLESKLPGENRYFRSRQGIVFYKESGQSTEGKAPVVFVHGIGAGNTSYEWLNNVGPLSEQYKVYAYDLLGFGNSDRPAIKYSAEVYIKQLTEFLDEVVKQPAYVVASSLAASYAVQVAYRRPELIEKLVLTSPTGINRVAGNQGVQILPGFMYYLLRTPVIGRSIYSGIASHKYIRSYMENQMFYDQSLVTDEMVQQYYVAAHQPGAEYAAYSFFTGLLNAEIGQTLGRVDKPVLIVQGKQDRQTNPEVGENLRRQNQAARLVTLEGARLVPQWEQAAEFNRVALDFLSQPDKPSHLKLAASDKTGVHAGATGDELKTHETAPGQPESVTDKVGEVADKVQGKAAEAAGKVTDLAAKAGDKAGQAKEQLQARAEDSGADVEQAAKDLSDKFIDQANQEHTASDHQLEASQQADKPKIKPLKSQTKPLGAGEQTSQPDQGSKLGQLDAATEFDEHRDLNKELQEHRETFLGDADTGAALLEDKDNNGVDDRRMGNQS
jgi:pimeloyl-ACP methyl ester carboxylesterase